MHGTGPTGGPVTMELGEDFPELREVVRRVCGRYPGEYWRGLDDVSAYPTEFIEHLTEAGFLAALIPEEYGGTGLPLRAAAVILEEINASGCTASQGTPRCTSWAHSCGTAAPSRSKDTCRR